MAKKPLIVIREGRSGITVPLINDLKSMVESEGKYSIENCVIRFRDLMLVHSYLYYHCDTSVVSDTQWQDWAYRLMVLQDSLPDNSKLNYYDSDFNDWDGSSGFDLPVDDHVHEMAEKIYKLYTGEPLPKPKG